MKNQKFTQFLSCATMFAIMSSMTACGEKNSEGSNNNKTERPVQTAGEVITNSYASESIDTVPEDIHAKITSFEDAHLVWDQIGKNLVGLKRIVDVNGFIVYPAGKGELHSFFSGCVMKGIQYELCHLIGAADLEVVVLLDAVRQDIIQEWANICATGIEKDSLQHGCLADVIDTKEQIQF